MFRSSTEKAYNLELIIDRLKKNLMKKDSNLTRQQLDGLVNTVALYHKNQFKFIPHRLYKDSNKDLVDLVKEDEKTLMEFFNISNLYGLLNFYPNYTKERFRNDDDFRRAVMHVVLYEIIEQNGKVEGAEYGMIFARIFNFDLAVPMHYASYNGMFDPRFLKFYDAYLGIGGTKYTYWLPNYFDGNDKSKYNMEDLSDLTPQLRKYIERNKINSKK